MTDLDDVIADAKTIEDLKGVYWCARDLSSFPLGNHHFFTIIWGSFDEAMKWKGKYWLLKDKLDFISIVNDAGLEIYFSTIALRKDGDKIDVVCNDRDDLKSVTEEADSDERNWYRPDFDLEGHKIDPLPGQTFDDLVTAILGLWQDYQAKRKSYNLERLTYSLLDENCAAMVNGFLGAIGYTAAQREALGEMWGIDWGEEDSFPMDYYSAMLPAYAKANFKGLRDLRIELSANCKTLKGDSRKSTLDITYIRRGDIENLDGKLVWDRDSLIRATDGLPGKPFVPGGSYVRSSTDIQAKLTAKKLIDGKWTDWSTDLGTVTKIEDVNSFLQPA